MIASLRQISSQIRLWLIAAAAILVLASALEASHLHGTLAETDNHCVLCQQSFSLEKPTSQVISFAAVFLPTIFAPTILVTLQSSGNLSSFNIRAPPAASLRH